uniref:ATP-dependent Clp protease proteolytic subunit n=1 Tax=Portulaca grandiflora TaxID=3583 RepID=A0A411JW77_PORGR|nr:ATP-dependent Clp protease proteolytic subunit [Portulaca grandiflora]QBC69342.1 ATP-dependent Clp protease proteolytic subunit [Portulaca grandiflora]UOX27407.1 ATP-dependent Clp protease proteolytic subunit [Portulaca grandiflora]
MPIGVPKVPYQAPDEEEASWVDIYDLLHQRRVLFLGQELDIETGNQIMGLMAFLSLEDPTEDLYLFINSPGGLAISGIGIYNMMRSVLPDVYTLGLGVAASMAAFVLAGGTVTKRLAFPHCRIMIHQPASAFIQDKAGDFLLQGAEVLYLREKITRIFAQRTGKPMSVISEDMERDLFMSATEAQAYGIVDSVAAEEND